MLWRKLNRCIFQKYLSRLLWQSFSFHQSCWVSFSNNLIWTFVGPVLLVCLVRIIFRYIKPFPLATLVSKEIKEIKSCDKHSWWTHLNLDNNNNNDNSNKDFAFLKIQGLSLQIRLSKIKKSTICFDSSWNVPSAFNYSAWSRHIICFLHNLTLLCFIKGKRQHPNAPFSIYCVIISQCYNQ